MSILQQIALGSLKDPRNGKEQSPGTHLGHGQTTRQYDKINKPEKSQGKSLENGVEGATDPITGEILFQVWRFEVARKDILKKNTAGSRRCFFCICNKI